MKSLGKVALIGALTLGSFVATGLVSSPAKAASPVTVAPAVVDDWAWQTYFSLHHNADYRQELAVGTLKVGDTFDITTYVGGKDVGVVKIYRVGDQEYGDLQRYKTIQASDAGNHYYSRFTTPITNVYTPGTYTAVLKVGDNYYYGGKFTITN